MFAISIADGAAEALVICCNFYCGLAPQMMMVWLLWVGLWYDAVKPNFFSGWRRSAMVIMVDIVVDFFGWRWREG